MSGWKGPNKARYKPKERVALAIVRLSRDRWLSPLEIKGLEARFFTADGRGTWSGGTWRSLGYSNIWSECRAIGMLRGRPPVFCGDPGYGDLVEVLGARKKWKPLQAEMCILNFKLKQKVNR